jgi:hypothetical protein
VLFSWMVTAGNTPPLDNYDDERRSQWASLAAGTSYEFVGSAIGRDVALALTLSALPDVFAICRLDRDTQISDWMNLGDFVSITRTADELSIVCPQIHVPEDVNCDKGWRRLKVEGPLNLSLTGVLASLAAPLAQAGIAVFAISTYDTDYLLVRDETLEHAAQVLSQAGHRVRLRP